MQADIDRQVAEIADKQATAVSLRAEVRDAEQRLAELRARLRTAERVNSMGVCDLRRVLAATKAAEAYLAGVTQ